MTYRKLDPEKMRVLGMTFLFLHEDMPKGKVDMGEMEFNQCGTSACHAGWFAIARGLTETYDYTYYSSANEMAEYLGFDSAYSIGIYFNLYSDLWGNTDATKMFCSRRAFVAKGILTLETIGLHWLQVADRVEAENERRGLA